MPPDVIIPVPERDKMRQRIHSLFAEIELLAVQPASDVDVVRREIETLRLRVVDLETQFYELKKVENLAAREEETRPRAESGTISLAEPQPVQSRPAAPLLYEKERWAMPSVMNECSFCSHQIWNRRGARMSSMRC